MHLNIRNYEFKLVMYDWETEGKLPTAWKAVGEAFKKSMKSEATEELVTRFGFAIAAACNKLRCHCASLPCILVFVYAFLLVRSPLI